MQRAFHTRALGTGVPGSTTSIIRHAAELKRRVHGRIEEAVAAIWVETQGDGARRLRGPVPRRGAVGGVAGAHGGRPVATAVSWSAITRTGGAIHELVVHEPTRARTGPGRAGPAVAAVENAEIFEDGRDPPVALSGQREIGAERGSCRCGALAGIGGRPAQGAVAPGGTAAELGSARVVRSGRLAHLVVAAIGGGRPTASARGSVAGCAAPAALAGDRAILDVGSARGRRASRLDVRAAIEGVGAEARVPRLVASGECTRATRGAAIGRELVRAAARAADVVAVAPLSVVAFDGARAIRPAGAVHVRIAKTARVAGLRGAVRVAL